MNKVKTFFDKLNICGCDNEINEFAESDECKKIISITPLVFSDGGEQFIQCTVLYETNQ